MPIHHITHPLYYVIVPQGAVITPRAHGIDVSKYDLQFTPEQATGQLDFVIQRVSYRKTRDELFDALLPGVLNMPVRGGYHYLNSDTDWKAQADAYLSFVDGIDYHFHACDFEGAFNVLSTAFAYQAWQWIRYVKQATGQPVFLYTSLSLYNAWIATSESIYGIDWDTVPYWQAQWFLTPNPNGTPTMPTKRTGGWQFWQYTDKGNGTLYGLGRSYAADLDVYNGSVDDLREYLNISEPVPPPADGDVTTHPFAGVTSITGTRYGWKFWIDIFDPAKVQVEVTHAKTTDKRDTVSAIAKTKGAELAYNGGEWDRGLSPAYPLDYSVSNGSVYQPDSGLARPSLILPQSGTPKIVHEGKSPAWQAVSGARYILQNGQPPAYLDGTAPQYTEGHNRTCYGVTADGKVMVMTCNGAYPNQGLTLKQAAVLMQSYGAVTAFDGGGGGDTTRVVNGVVTNNPQDGAERRVPEFVLFYAEKETGMAYGIARERFGNTSVVRKSPSRYGTEIRRLNGYAQVNFTEKVATIPQGTADKAGEMWLKLDDGNYVNWKLFNSSGVLTDMFSILSEPTTDPVPPPANEYSVTVTITDSDGWYGEGTITVKPK